MSPASSSYAHSREGNSLVLDELLAPAMQVLTDYVRDVRHEGVITDPAFVHLGVLRVLSQVVSGRDFLQQVAELHDRELARASFFDTLHSERRKAIVCELNAQLTSRNGVGAAGPEADLLSSFSELQGRAVFAVDGHQIEHACHSRPDSKGRYVPGNTLYLLCLHSGLMVNFGAVQGDGRYRHEMPVFRSRAARWLTDRARTRPGCPIFVADPAFVDKQFWTRMALLRERGALVITRTKTNMCPTVYSRYSWDQAAQVNLGVLADELVGFDGSCLMRRVHYRDPETGTEYEFLTTVRDLLPGTIAMLYLLRWRLEKVFDTGKNKLAEKKGWATGEVAREIQGHFFALAHNLLVLLRRRLHRDHGIREVKLEKKRAKWLRKRAVKALAAGRKVHPLQWKLPAVVQLSLQLIRALRNAIIGRKRWLEVLPTFACRLNAYL